MTEETENETSEPTKDSSNESMDMNSMGDCQEQKPSSQNDLDNPPSENKSQECEEPLKQNIQSENTQPENDDTSGDKENLSTDTCKKEEETPAPENLCNGHIIPKDQDLNKNQCDTENMNVNNTENEMEHSTSDGNGEISEAMQIQDSSERTSCKDQGSAFSHLASNFWMQFL